MHLIDLIESPRWPSTAESRTLYHGTTLESAQSAMEHGLWPSIGEFVQWAYGEEEEDALPELVFAADKSSLNKVFSAITFQVQHKLRGKSRFEGASPISPEEFLQHGAILVIREGGDQMVQSEHGYDYPSVEPMDWYSHEDVEPSFILTGSKLRDFMRRNKAWPFTHPSIDWSNHRTKGKTPRKPVKEADLNEVHYEDIFGENFEKFHKKYRNLVRRKEINVDEYWVNFTNHKDNTLDRTAWHNPDHTDPVGTYCYPLKYVLSHPADIWYGGSANYLRVIKATPRNPLILTNIDRWVAVDDVLRRMGIRMSERELKKVKRYAQHKGSSKKTFARTLMSAFQINFDGVPERSWGMDRFPMRPGTEQTQMLLKAGYDAIIDNGTGSINEREPEQAVFLSRGAFRVEEVIRLHGKDQNDVGAFTVNDPNGDKTFIRKFAQKIAEQLDDKLVGGTETTNLGGWRYHWTKKGRRIEIIITLPDHYYDDLSIGEKRHKYYQKHTNHIVEVTVRTEHGDISKRWTRGDVRMDEMVQQIGNAFRANQRMGMTSDWTPEDRTTFRDKMEQARRLHIANNMRKERGLPPFGSLDELEALNQQGLNVFGEPFDQARIKALIEEIKFLNKALIADGLPKITVRLAQEWDRINTARREKNELPITARQFLRQKGVQVPSPGQIKNVIPFSFAMDTNSVYYMDHLEPVVVSYLTKIGAHPKTIEKWESTFNSWVQTIAFQFEHDAEPTPFPEYIRSNYKLQPTGGEPS